MLYASHFYNFYDSYVEHTLKEIHMNTIFQYITYKQTVRDNVNYNTNTIMTINDDDDNNTNNSLQ